MTTICATVARKSNCFSLVVHFNDMFILEFSFSNCETNLFLCQQIVSFILVRRLSHDNEEGRRGSRRAVYLNNSSLFALYNKADNGKLALGV